MPGNANSRDDTVDFPDAENSTSGQGNARPWRVFVNHVDSYHGGKLAAALSEREYVSPQSGDVGINEEKEETEGEDKEKERTEEFARKYEVIGTVLDPRYSCPEAVTIIIPGNRETLVSEILSCGIVIYDITQESSQIEEARSVLQAIREKLEETRERSSTSFERAETRYFILISTVMTWALTKPLDPEDPDLPFTEADYRKRRSHPNYRDHIRCEKDVVILKKRTDLRDKLRTLVICCGVTYGDEEDTLHYLFKMAWQNAPFLPVLGDGTNRIPLLHVRDLVSIVIMVLQNWPELRYIVAVEQGIASQYVIAKKISEALGNGRTKRIPKEEAFLLPEVSQRVYDCLTIDLNIEPAYVADRTTWHFEGPFPDSVHAIAKEYRTSRDLRPVKIVVLGPPAAGKTRLARQLASYYGIHYVHVETLITETVQRLTAEIESAKSVKENEINEDDGEKEVNVEELEELLDQIRRNLSENNGRLDDGVLSRLFLMRLQSRDCLNQGYVMDGYPRTLEEARLLFGINEENFVDNEEKGTDIYSLILPELVVALEATDEFLMERAMSRPEKELRKSRYTEERMVRRLREYRKRNTDECTPLQFFDELEIHPLVVAIENDTTPDMLPTFRRILQTIGKPRNYGPTAEERIEADKREEAEKREAEIAERVRAEKEIAERKRERDEKMMEWMKLKEKLIEEEEDRLRVMGEPLRHYLAKYILPTLTQGLIEVARLRPDDPIDFLAEYLFKENPEGKMFEPEYTETVSMLFDAIAKLQNDIFSEEELKDNAMKFLRKKDDQFSEDLEERGKEKASIHTRSTLSFKRDLGYEENEGTEEIYFPEQLNENDDKPVFTSG